MVKVEYSSTIGRAFKFAIDIKLLLFLYIFNMIFFAPLIGFGVWLLRSNIFIEGLQPTAFLGTFVGFIIGFIALMIIFGLLAVLVNMILVDFYKSRKSLGKSFNNVKPKYFRMLGVAIVVGLISMVLGWVPYIGFVFSILLSLIFLFMYQLVVIGGKRFGGTFESSWKLFKTQFWDVLLTWLINIVICMVIIFIFAIPLLIMIVGLVFSAISGNFAVFAGSLITKLPMLIIGGLIFLVGAVMATLFGIGLLTDAYMQLQKKAKF